MAVLYVSAFANTLRDQQPRVSSFRAGLLRNPSPLMSSYAACTVCTGQNFRQQNMWALKPVWSPKCIMIMYFIVAIVFIPVGTVVLVQSLQMMRTDSVRYDDIELCDIGETSSTTTVNTCVIPINITKETKAPSYMYYGLVNYFQNARRYIDSRSAEQLRGQANPDTGLCKSDIGEEIAEAVPCGLTAFSMFNDTFDLCRDEECDALVDLKKEGIAWDVDRDVRFLPGEIGTEDGYTEESNALVTDEDFMVWMRVAAYNNFHKLYRIVEEDLEPGVYYVRVNASYPVSGFGGEKFVYISETRWFGGRSRFLGGSYLAIGVLALLMATFILVRVQRMPEDKLPPATDVPAEGYDEDDLQAPPDARSSELDNGGTATDRLAKEVGASPSTYTHASG